LPRVIIYGSALAGFKLRPDSFQRTEDVAGCFLAPQAGQFMRREMKGQEMAIADVHTRSSAPHFLGSVIAVDLLSFDKG
jgi:hypothetical protein